nr:peptidyl-prolyl cis-trans isomerase-like 6 [Aotus nancymaae]
MGSPQPCRPQHARCGSPPLPERPLQVKVVGLFSCPNFQIAKSAAENLKNNHPSKFEDPILVPLQEFAWHQYLQEKKRELKNETWEYSSSVISFVNDQLLGDALDLQKWAHEVWDIVDVKPSALYDALAEDFSTKFLRDTRASYANFSFYLKIQMFIYCYFSDIVSGKGDNGESIYGPTFEDENFSVPHNKRGVLGMANKGRHSNGSQFYITLQATPYLDRKFVAFGQLIEGTEVLKQLELVPTENERPIPMCRIIDSGDPYA